MVPERSRNHFLIFASSFFANYFQIIRYILSKLVNLIKSENGNKPIKSHINYWNQVNSWKHFWKFWNGPSCRKKSGPFPLLNVAAYWQSSDSGACVKKLFQILANNIDHGGRGIDLRIYVRYCRLTFKQRKICWGSARHPWLQPNCEKVSTLLKIWGTRIIICFPFC